MAALDAVCAAGTRGGGVCDDQDDEKKLKKKGQKATRFKRNRQQSRRSMLRLVAGLGPPVGGHDQNSPD